MSEDPSKAFDLAIFGTGVLECILASAAAVAGKSVLHVDSNAFYGARDASFDFRSLLLWALDCQNAGKDLASNGSISAFRTGFDQFDFYVSGMMHSGAQERMLLEETAQDTLLSDIATDLAAGVPELAVLVEQMLAPSSADPSDVSISLINNRAHNLRFLLQRSRHFNLELFPRLVYSSGSVIELLLASGVNNYLEFKALESAAVKWDGVIKTVPVSKEDIFNNGGLSLIEKRTLMKCLKTVAEMAEDGAGADGSFKDFLRQQGLSESVVKVFVESVAAALELKDDVQTRDGILGTRRYLKSCGRYGRTPFLCFAYGGGAEMAQGFSRSCAVHGGTYMLDQQVANIREIDGSEHPVRIELSEGEVLAAQKAILNMDYTVANDSETDTLHVSRAIIITDRPCFSESELDFIVLPSEGEVPKVVVMQTSASNHTCPSGLFMLHFMTQSKGSPTADLRLPVMQFVDMGRSDWRNSEQDKPNALFCMFYRQRFRSPRSPTSLRGGNIAVVGDTPANFHYEDLERTALSLLLRLFPDVPFYPQDNVEQKDTEEE